MGNNISFKAEASYEGIDAFLFDLIKAAAQIKMMQKAEEPETEPKSNAFTTITISNKMRKSIIRLAKLVRQKDVAADAAAQDLAGTMLSLLKK